MYLTSGNETGVNLEYWFRLLYECFTGGCYGTADFSTFLTSLWQWVVIIGYLVVVVGLFFIIYMTIKIFDLRRREAEQLHEIIIAPGATGPNPRWAHIESLIESPTDSDWRQAIIEADIMLDDLLRARGYEGATVGERLKQVDPAKLVSLNDAWEAHKVRNEIAHQGSAFKISEHAAHRTVARYENAFHELGEI